jgi:hypothetical protein
VIAGDLIRKLHGAVERAKYDDAVVVAYELGSPPTYRAITNVHYNVERVEIGREAVPLAALKEGWRPDRGD